MLRLFILSSFLIFALGCIPSHYDHDHETLAQQVAQWRKLQSDYDAWFKSAKIFDHFLPLRDSHWRVQKWVGLGLVVQTLDENVRVIFDENGTLPARYSFTKIYCAFKFLKLANAAIDTAIQQEYKTVTRDTS